MERRFLEDKASKCVVTRAGEDGPRQIGGYAAVFYDGSPGTEFELWPDTFERIMPGAFDEALARPDDVRARVNHDSNQILGRTSAGTLRLSVDSKGLRYEIDLPDTTAGRDVFESVQRGDIDSSSFAFVNAQETWARDRDGNGSDIEIREVHSLELRDVAPVGFPAYEGTTAGVFRDSGDLVEARSAYDTWRAGKQAAGAQEGATAAYERRARILEMQELRDSVVTE